jgi:hypothetical protein
MLVSRTSFVGIRLEHPFVIGSYTNTLVIITGRSARSATNLLLPKQPLYAHLVYYFVDQPH